MRRKTHLSINHICFFLGLVLWMAAIGSSIAVLLMTGNVAATLCVLGFGVFAFGCGVLFVRIVRKKLVLFSDQFCELLDGMMSGKEELPEEKQQKEGLFYKIHYRLKRLYEVMQENRNHIAKEREDLQELISDISHQVKTPIANLKMINNTLLEKEVPAQKQQEFLTAQSSQLDKLDFLMQAMIKTSRLETGVISLEQREQSIYETLAAALGGIFLNAEKKKIDVQVDCPEGLMVSHDRKWTTEALFNILDNAVKYTPASGNIWVSVECWEMYVKIDITDNGIGISEEHQGTIFKRFYREDTVHDAEGIGIGLYLAREIISLQGGYIVVSSHPGNNNKAVIKKVANRNFHSNKKRNILAVIAIALTTFLLTAVLTIGFGAKNTLQYSEARLLGSQADALVQGMTKEQAEQLKENAMFEKAGIQIGIAFLENTKQLNVELDYADETLMEVCFMTPNIGTIPKAENEVLVSANVLEDLGIPQKAGETLPVDLKVDGKIEHFDMKVSGIYEPVKNDVGYVMVSKTFLEEQEEMISTLRKDRENRNYYNAHVILKDPSMVEERIGEFIRSIGGNPDDREAENYVRIAPTPSATQSDGNLVVWLAAGVFGILFMFGGYLLIYNVFDMSVTNDVRQYGLLRTIGTTPKQVKGLVRKQAMYLFLIGTPIGVLLGILLGKGMLPAVLQMFVAEPGEKNVVVGSLPYLPIIIGSVIFSALTVWISTRKSAKKASRVSPIEAVRYVEHSTGKIRERKHVKGALLPRMAKANVQRNKGRMVLVIVSLMLSIILLNSVFVFVGSVDEDIYVERKMRSDFAVYTAQAGLMQNHSGGCAAFL